MAGEETRCRPRRVSSTQQGHLLVAAQPSLDRRGPVRDTAALELRQVRDLRTSIARARSHYHRPCPDPPAVGKVEDECRIRARALGRAVQLLHLRGETEVPPELLALGATEPHHRLPLD